MGEREGPNKAQREMMINLYFILIHLNVGYFEMFKVKMKDKLELL